MTDDRVGAALYVSVPFLPPTANHCYFNNKWGGRTKTKEAEKFQLQFSQAVVASNLATISKLNPQGAYRVQYQFFFPPDEVRTKTHGKKGGAKSGHKKMDLENRLKLTTDALSKAIGIDDSQFYEELVQKLSSKMTGGPTLRIWVWEVDITHYGF